jgi:ribokinase
MTPRWDVLGYGAVAVDELYYVSHYPPADSKAPIVAQRRQGGGLTGTALVAAARLGVRAAYCGVLGDDPLSDYTRQAFAAEGVDNAPVLRQAGAEPVHSVVIVDQSTGARTILFSYAHFVPRRAESITEELIANCRVLFADHTGEQGGLRAAQIARCLGIPVVCDVERDDRPCVAELIEVADHLIIGVHMAQRLTGLVDPARMAQSLARPDRVCLAVTAGSEGCWFSESGGEIRHVPALAVRAVDTTGCGDVFHGAHAAGLARGMSVPKAIRLATVTAGIKATKPGGREGIATWDLVQPYL